MEITAELAHIELREGEIDALSAAVSQMVEYFGIMDGLTLEDTQPGHHIPVLQTPLRTDAALESALSDDILEQAPELEDRFISIPNVL